MIAGRLISPQILHFFFSHKLKVVASLGQASLLMLLKAAFGSVVFPFEAFYNSERFQPLHSAKR